MTDALTNILAAKRQHIARRKSDISTERMLKLARNRQLYFPPRGFQRALEIKAQQGRFALIAEIKKASPSKGLIRDDFNPAQLAKDYAAGGATCLSVLTDEPYFQGRDDYLVQARDAVTLPVLRKDFILDPYQVLESRALGADCILLIITALSDGQAQELEAAALEFSMDVLIEVHDEPELERALTHLQSTLVGINNRNLKTLEVSLATSEALAKHLPGHILAVCESGISAHGDLKRMKQSGFSCFLVGESLMREHDAMQATRTLLGENDGH